MQGSVFLDSVGLGSKNLFAHNPSEILTSKHSLHDIEKRIQSTHNPTKKNSGWIGYLSYEAARYCKEYENLPFKQTHLPEIWFAYYPEINSKIGLTTPLSEKQTVSDSITKEGYLQKIKKAQQYIHEGDIYQVNLSHRFTTRAPQNPFQLYQHLRQIAPAPYSAYIDIRTHQILSSSPELFFEITNGRITTRPIKGTAPRGKTLEEDESFRQSLINSKKDHAELLMITDLERNDLGKICRYGSVTVPQLISVETYSNVHHLVSTITGTLREEVTPFHALLALFPGGSITGAPKKRAMEIIQELETVPREIYTGAIGYILDNGDAQFNIAIRTAYTEGDNLHFHAGGAITADSDPEKEWDETYTKAQSFLKLCVTP